MSNEIKVSKMRRSKTEQIFEECLDVLKKFCKWQHLYTITICEGWNSLKTCTYFEWSELEPNVITRRCINVRSYPTEERTDKIYALNDAYILNCRGEIYKLRFYNSADDMGIASIFEYYNKDSYIGVEIVKMGLVEESIVSFGINIVEGILVEIYQIDSKKKNEIEETEYTDIIYMEQKLQDKQLIKVKHFI